MQAIQNLIISSIVCSLAYTSCINAPRDNKYDPLNPDKAEIIGKAGEPDGRNIAGVNVELIHEYDDEVVKSDTSDRSGNFCFDNIDPGVYRIHGSAPHFTEVSTAPESLWAGTCLDEYRLYFTTFDFEDDTEGAMPYGFSKIDGSWRVSKDPIMANEHSVPNVTSGLDIDGHDSAPSLTIFRTKAEYVDMALKLKVLNSSSPRWQTGIVFRYQDTENYYFTKIDSQSASIGFIKDCVESTLVDTNLVFLSDIWYTLKMRCDTAATDIYLDDALIFHISTINCVFPDGFFGMLVSSRESGIAATVNFDDILIDYKLQ